MDRLRQTLCCLVLAWLASGCNSLNLHPPAPQPQAAARPVLPGKHSRRIGGQVVLISDFELEEDLPLFRELGELGERVASDLALPVSTSLVQVYVFEDRPAFRQYMKSHPHFKDLPDRRAYFVIEPRRVGGEDLCVYTFWGDRVQEDLRHELTHALLHGVLAQVPLWLDEGLAEYYEVPASYRGTHPQHLEIIRAEPFAPDLERLESLREVRDMKEPEYREAWAWVHWMLHGSPETRRVLLDYLQQLRATPNPGPLGPRLAAIDPSPPEALGRHLSRLSAVGRR